MSKKKALLSAEEYNVDLIVPSNNKDTSEKNNHVDTISAMDEVPVKKKVGRPKVKTEECKTINVAIPLSILAKIDIAKVKYEGNLTKYVNAIIEKDLDANFDSYQQLYDLLKN